MTMLVLCFYHSLPQVPNDSIILPACLHLSLTQYQPVVQTMSLHVLVLSFKLAGVNFAHSAECLVHAMVVHLLLLFRGLSEKLTVTKDHSAIIIDNMSKFVDNPLDADPFLHLLCPALEQNADAIADPGAREVTGRAVAHLMRLQGMADKQACVHGDTSELTTNFKKALGADASDANLEVFLVILQFPHLL